ncbi:hypothetical protein DIU31_014345 [Mucilaginibacter rubeus]|uniref:Uncharacterized protein n=1 Tax=Mucilaginibacter rubeus TaxID=2027860 RepID=A0AAE6JGL7_9SPHI|nr:MULTISPECIES: hypothetical protein [Mucilaginibacter]QEM04635.1 hypothetical protein DIU31_014345 [Mucilaginibacter rubeus]QEM17227.1 hypothetical protein DIU38_014485 [Mucilaginibacter gossypii]QTE46266.1 hypothetical protein J3L19_13215 [Mucilaginibacter rubeus]QTE52863.1 hypothetical protein J3L21_13190 [Mucilaginibacter rubeus]QTE57949.1 hypothetical protein J3L23_04860 [Mucilaginibacter rubeus]
MNRKILFLFLFQVTVLKSYAQLQTYYHKIESVSNNEKSATRLFQRIDSIKQTRQPHDSKVTTYFNRDVDFGYKHQRITVIFNGSNRYYVNLLTMGDSILISSVCYDNSFFGDPLYDKLNKRENHPKIDTTKVLQYLKRRNDFYKSSKNIEDLVKELNLYKMYAFYCGDASPKTKMGEYIDELVKNRDIKKLKNLLFSFCCEEQAYGVAGIKTLQKKNVKIPVEIIRIASYVNDRKSELITCSGCIVGIISTDY